MPTEVRPPLSSDLNKGLPKNNRFLTLFELCLDVANSNVAFTCKNAVESEEELFFVLGDPVTADYSNEEIPWSPELPKQLVQYTVWPGWYEAPNEELRLLDLGLAFPVGSTVKGIAQPRDVRSPETFFIGSFDYRHDLWRAGCVVGILLAYFFLLLLVSPFSMIPSGHTNRPLTDILPILPETALSVFLGG